MNLRQIKKDIEYVIGAFIDDCSLFATVRGKEMNETINGLLEEAVALYNDLRDRVNAKGVVRRQHFAALRRELMEKTDSMYERLGELVKTAAVK